MGKYEILKEYFGHTEFREGQEKIIDSLIKGRDCLCVMPTGAGKSLCYQVPSLIMSGVTIVISPLISLMKDQVASLIQSGVKAAYINSSLTMEQYNSVMRNTMNGKYKIIYVAPERLLVEGFLSVIKSIEISMIAVDEAHCVSQWGQDFRPSYLKIVEFINSLNNRPVIGAFTATATSEVKDDIENILNLNDPLRIATGFDRENLYFSVLFPEDKKQEILSIVKERKSKCGIVYCQTRSLTEEVCELLCVNGFKATRYHAGLDPIERKENQEAFNNDTVNIMVATNAFGMGIDKSNVSFVIHYNMPMDVESYYQEAGRAGRDGEKADCILLYSGMDVRTNMFLLEKSEPNTEITPEMQKAVKEKDLERLKYMTYYCRTTECLRAYILNYFGDKSESFCGACSNCNQGFETVDITIEAQKILSCVARTKQKYGRSMIIDILRGSKNQRLLSLGLDKQSTYGIMADTKAKSLRTIMDYLFLNNYITQTNSEYPTVSLTELSVEILKGDLKVEMKVPLKAKAIKDALGDSVDIDYELLIKLKDIRTKLAKKARVPAYIIFSDKSLNEMCIKKPTTISEFIDISGVGKRKQEMYGEIFINAIKSVK